MMYTCFIPLRICIDLSAEILKKLQLIDSRVVVAISPSVFLPGFNYAKLHKDKIFNHKFYGIP